MTHIHAHDPDNPCPVDNDDTPEDLAAYRAAEEAGRDDDGCSTEAAFAIYTAWRIAGCESGKYPQGKHWNGPYMRPHISEADRAAWREEERARQSAAWAARAATSDFVCPIGHRHLKTPEGWMSIGLFATTPEGRG
jgi:hypothetical protein